MKLLRMRNKGPLSSEWMHESERDSVTLSNGWTYERERESTNVRNRRDKVINVL